MRIVDLPIERLALMYHGEENGYKLRAVHICDKHLHLVVYEDPKEGLRTQFVDDDGRYLGHMFLKEKKKNKRAKTLSELLASGWHVVRGNIQKVDDDTCWLSIWHREHFGCIIPEDGWKCWPTGSLIDCE